MKRQQAKGFTLIELMIVIVIIGILAAIAYPAYVDQVRKSRRADCAGVLTGLSAALERNFTITNTYGGLGAAGASTGAPVNTFYPAKCPISPPGLKYYNLTIFAADETTYEIRAVRAGDQVNDKCGDLTLTHTGVKGLDGNDAVRTVALCW